MGVVVSTIGMAGLFAKKEKIDIAKRLGVVIFNDEYFSHEGLAALKWASDLLPQAQLVRILLVKDDVGGQRERTDLKTDDLRYLVDQKGEELKDDWLHTLEVYINKFSGQKHLGKSYGGSSIDELLEEAIKDFELDTLVFGMAAVGSTRTRRIDLQLNSKCSVVLAKMVDAKPLKLKMTIEISDAPADGDVIVAQENTALPDSTSQLVDPSPEQGQDVTTN